MPPLRTTRLSLFHRIGRAPGDPGVWTEFVATYGPAVVLWCRGHGLQDSDAHDVAQDVLVRFWRQAERFRYDPSLRFRSHLRRMVLTAVSDWSESRRAGQITLDDPALERLLGSVPARADLAARIEEAFDMESHARDRIRSRGGASPMARPRLRALHARTISPRTFPMPARPAPLPVRRPRVSPAITLAAICVHLLGQTAALVRAGDVTITTPTTGGQVGEGGTFTIAATGSVTNDAGAAVTSTSGNEITTFANLGGAFASTTALFNDATSMTALVNSGTMGGGTGISTTGTIDTVTNAAGGTIKGTAYDGVQNLGSIGSLTNSGTIQGIGRAGIHNEDSSGAASIDAIVNDAGGEITGGTGIFNENTLGNGATLGSLTNAGTISGSNDGVVNAYATLTTLTNSGSISGGGGGVRNMWGTIGTVANSGSIGGGDDGVFNLGTITSLANSGTISGTALSGVYNAGSVGTLTNSGTISGTTSAFSAALVNGGGTIDHIVNTGSIGDVRNGGTIGTGSGLAIASTGVGASIGDIYNQGVIDGSVTVDNQDLIVHGGVDFYSTGGFTGGVITVSDGSLTCADGFTFLGSNVSLDAGAGTLTNRGTLFVDAPLTLDGSLALAAGSTFGTFVTSLSTFGSLAVGGDAAFDGVLDVLDFLTVLADGQTYTLFSFANATGTFSGLAVNGTLLASLGAGQWAYGGLVLTEVWGANDFSLSITAAVPEIDPAGIGSVLALLGGALSLLERGRFARSRRHAA